MLKRVVLVFAGVAALATTARAQQASDSIAVIAVAQTALRAISTKDAALMRTVLLPGAFFASAQDPASPQAAVRVQSDSAFYVQLATAKQAYLERMWSPSVFVQGSVALVRAPYDFHVDGTFSHCGVDTFTLVKSKGAWMITHLAYTVQRAGCGVSPLGAPKP